MKLNSFSGLKRFAKKGPKKKRMSTQVKNNLCKGRVISGGIFILVPFSKNGTDSTTNDLEARTCVNAKIIMNKNEFISSYCENFFLSTQWTFFSLVSMYRYDQKLSKSTTTFKMNCLIIFRYALI